MHPPLRIGLPILLILLAGCEDEASSRRQTAETAAAARQLVEADAAMRKDFVALEKDLASERSAVDRQRDVLEQERKDLAQERHQAPLIQEGLHTSALMLLCALPLFLCWALLRSAGGETGLAELEDLLILEVSGADHVLAGPPLLAADESRDPRRLADSPPEEPATE